MGGIINKGKQMQDWTIKKRILFGFIMVIGINMLVGAFACFSIYQMRAQADDIAGNWMPSVYDLGILDGEVKRTQVLILEHILADTKEETATLDTQLTGQHDVVAKQLKDYEATVDPSEKSLFEATGGAWDDYWKAIQPIRALSLNLQTKDATTAMNRDLKPLYDRLRDTVRKEIEYNKHEADRVTSSSVATANRASVGVITGLVAALVLALMAATAIIRSTSKVLSSVAGTLDTGSNEIAAAAGQVSASSQSLAEGASEQAASLEETSASMEEIRSMTRRNAENAQGAQALSGQTRAAAEAGAQRTEEMQGAVEAIKEASEEMRDAIAGIKSSSDNVSKIIKTIDEIAFQTNILALNAAVEAARAGEAGMGFAVVAEEVRNLAQRSAVAAKETAQMIEAAVAQSTRGVEVNEKVGARIGEIAAKSGNVRDSLRDIVGKIREVDALVDSIATASKEQTSGLEQIGGAMTQMDQVTQSSAAAAEETASAAEELNAQSVELRGAVEALTRLVGGSGEHGAHGRNGTNGVMSAIPFPEPARKPGFRPAAARPAVAARKLSAPGARPARAAFQAGSREEAFVDA